jgi:hypothetical protein
MSSRRKFKRDGKFGSVRGHTEIFASAPSGAPATC